MAKMSWREWPPWRVRAHERLEKEQALREQQRHQSEITSIDTIAQQLREGRQHADRADFWRSVREWVTIAGLIITTAIAFIALFDSLDQSKATREFVKAAEKSFAEQALHTRESLELADQSNKTARDAFIANSRAWIQAGIKAHGYVKPNTDLDLEFWVKNVGKTPARNVRMSINIALTNINVPPVFQPYQELHAQTGKMYPDEPLRQSLGRVITPMQSMMWHAKQLVIVVKGEITYQDVFTDIVHTETFCGYIGNQVRAEDVAWGDDCIMAGNRTEN
jgi:hypothetical protein